MQLRTVLCPIDFTAITDHELDAAVEVCSTFGARLVLHHNVSANTPGLGRQWEWGATHRGREMSEAEAERRLHDLLERLPEGIDAEAMIGRGPVGMVLLHLARELPADLMVIGCHGGSDEERSSTTERILEDCSCPVLALHDEAAESHPFQLRSLRLGRPARVVAPTDLSPAGDLAVAYAVELARRVPLELHLLHVLAGRSADDDEAARLQLAQRVPADLAATVDCHLERGRPAEAIAAFAERRDADFIVMGEHARGLLRRVFTPDTSRELLHRAGRAVWYVPPVAA